MGLAQRKMDHADSCKAETIRRIWDRSARIGVVGLGYVGLPLAMSGARAGFRVTGIDVNAGLVKELNGGKSRLPDVDSSLVQQYRKEKKFEAVSNFKCIKDLDVIIITVPTPLSKNLTPDLKFIEAACNEIAKYIRPGQLISLESTTYPGTTEQVVLPILDASGHSVEEDFFLVYSPERIDPGNATFNTENTPKVVGGIGVNSLEVGIAFYSQVLERVVSVSNTWIAEMVKVFENTFRSVNIALVNEFAMLCHHMKVNVWEVLQAAFTKPFGIMPFYPGPGVGGHCIPLDPHYLEWKAKEINFTTHFIALAGEINRNMPQFVCDKAVKLLNDSGLAPKNAKILILGVAYKKDSHDHRESPAVDVIRLLRKTGAAVEYHDPYVPEFEVNDFQLTSVPLEKQNVEQFDIVVITTNHSGIDYDWLVQHAKMVFDTRNVTKTVTKNRQKIRLL